MEQTHELAPTHICTKDRQDHIVDWALDMELHSMLQFTPCDLWQVLQHRSLWVVGDSQSADTWVAMICFMREFWNLTITDRPGNADVEALQFLKEATSAAPTVSLEQVKCAELTAGGGTGRICHMRVNEVEAELALGMALLQHLSRGTQPIVVSNWGLWQHRAHIFGAGLQQLLLMLNTGQYPFWIWKDTPPQHFQWRNGEFYPAGHQAPFQCYPHNTTLQPDKTLVAKPGYEAILTGLWRNTMPYGILHPHIPYVNTWNLTSMLWDFHRDNYGHGHECSHFCHPGAPQVWIYHIYEKIKAFAPADVVLPERFHPSGHMSHRRQQESDAD
ncbi:hypothetical protein WJX73_000443 [Symbiochloris irregularis]|uniref:Uncharacterized protein n=1 Tax=Symbiochloris irregularis TaxID=706552 RepID=A0AAW1NSS1_9CHLO